MKTITASDANRHFSRVLREVSQGEAFVVISRGKSVATIGPMNRSSQWAQSTRAALIERLRSQSVTGVIPWTRQELYEDAP